MASTILLKHGPGAPTSGELEYRELGYDHTNHKLYIGNSSGGVTLLNPTFNGGTITSSLTPSGGIAYAGNENYIAYPGGGSFTTTSPTLTGFLKIILPVSWNSTMIKFKVSIYNYINDSSTDYYIGGYNFSGDGGQWTCLSAYSIGVGSIANLPVIFGHDGSKCLIAIGSATTTWSYPQVVVSDVTIGFTGGTYNAFKTGWNVVINNTAISNIDKTISNPKITSNIITGAASTITSSNLTASRALISNSSGKVAVSSVSSTELGYLDGVTSSIQTQLNGKLSTSGTAAAATKLATARTIRTNLASTSTASFNGTANITPGVTGKLAIANGGTGGTSGLEAANNLKLLYLNGGNIISSGSDLNDYMDSGVYFSGSSSNTIYNKPASVDNAFNMLVFRPLSGSGNTYLVQYLMPFSSTGRIFYRSYDPWASDTNWRPWREIFTTYICNPHTIIIGRNGSNVQELDAYSLTQTLFGEFYASSTVLACNGDRSACTDAIIATTKVSNKVYRLVFDANSTSNMRINLLNFMF